MTLHTRRFTAALAFAGLLIAHIAGAAAVPEIWLTPIDPFNLHDRNAAAEPDLMDMLRADAPWANAAAHVSVLKNATRFVATSSDAMLSSELQGLRARHIDYGMETGLVPWSAACGQGVEGFSAMGSAAGLAKKIQRLNGIINDLSMDEPLFFAHRYSGRNACYKPIKEIAQQVAVEVAALKRIFPTIQIGDIEPVGIPGSQDWVDSIMEWVAAYRAATGEPLRFLHADVNWHGPWREQLRTLRARLHAEGIAFGIIYIGDPSDVTDDDATRHAEERMVEVAKDPLLAPDQVIIQSWLRHPERNLPETQPGTMTYLVDRYLTEQTVLTARREGNRIVGQLGDAAGRPVNGARIEITDVDNGKGQVVRVRTLSGVVPPNASSAVLGVRINIECDCRATANIGIGTLRYIDRGSGEVIERTLPPLPGQTAGARMIAARGQPFLRNSLPVPVRAGAPYTIELPMRVSYDSTGSGYAMIVFLDSQNREVRRDQLPFEPTTQSLGHAVTNAAGRFWFSLAPDVLRSNFTFALRFSGDTRYRLTSAIVP